MQGIMTNEEIKAHLVEIGYPESKVFEDPSFDTACIGFSSDGRAVYSFDKMVNWLMENWGLDESEATDHIEYDTLRSLPLIPNAPIVVYETVEDAEECIADITEGT